MNRFDVVVIGQGVAGLASASALAARGCTVAAFEAEFFFGGLVANRVELDFFPEGEGVSGMDYAAGLAAANARRGVVVVQEGVATVRGGAEGLAVETTGGKQVLARAVVVASGARVKMLDVPGESSLQGRGVAQCAECDGPLFRGLPVAVAGGGDWALQAALILARDCSEVHVVHDGPEPTAHPDFLVRARAATNIGMLPSSRIVEILGDELVTGVRVQGPQGALTLAVDGVFSYAGLQPNTDFLPADVERVPGGCVNADATLETSMPGVWVVGQARAGFPGLLSAGLQDASLVAGAIATRLLS